MLKLITITGMLLFFTSCASSLSPIEVNQTLPSLTKSKFITQAEAEEAVKTSSCKYLVKKRTYTAPIGFTAKDDLKNGARGIDEWVKLDKGNAYVLTNYNWVSVGDQGATELHLEFDTLLCE